MGARELGTLLDGGHYFEGPRWHDGRWWVSDFYRHCVFTVTSDGEVADVLTLAGDEQPSGMDWLPDGSLVVVAMRAQAPAHRRRRRRQRPRGPQRPVRRPPQRHGRGGRRHDLRRQLDAEHHVWAANALGGNVGRISPQGEVVETIQMPDGVGVFACMLGGEDGRTLLCCTAPDFAEENRKAAREAKHLTVRVDVSSA